MRAKLHGKFRKYCVALCVNGQTEMTTGFTETESVVLLWCQMTEVTSPEKHRKDSSVVSHGQIIGQKPIWKIEAIRNISLPNGSIDRRRIYSYLSSLCLLLWWSEQPLSLGFKYWWTRQFAQEDVLHFKGQKDYKPKQLTPFTKLIWKFEAIRIFCFHMEAWKDLLTLYERFFASI